jgi:hypothetical protein
MKLILGKIIIFAKSPRSRRDFVFSVHLLPVQTGDVATNRAEFYCEHVAQRHVIHTFFSELPQALIQE